MYHPPKPIPVSIVTGFLGAGKSTLLNRLLRDPKLNDAAVIINEFGEVGIDHLLVETSGDSIIELSNGCLCCTIRGELIDTLAELLDAMQTKRIKPVGRVIIETTGLADPVPVLLAIMAHPGIGASFCIDGMITLIDALNGLETLGQYDEAVRQAVLADRLIITKTDLANAQTMDKLREKLTALNPMANLIDISNPIAADPNMLVTGFFDPNSKSDAVGEWLSKNEPINHHHDHDVNRHGAHIRAFTLLTKQPVLLSTVEAFQHRLASEHGAHILRVKGIVSIEGTHQPTVIHGVRDMVYPPSRLENWPNDKNRETRLVVITCDLSEHIVQELFDTFLNRPGIDRPDRAAIEDSPLSAFGFKP